MKSWLKQLGKAKRRLDVKTQKKLGPIRRRKLKGGDFSVISNNCWGGMVYQHFDLPYGSPTAGLYFFPEEYLRFAGDLRRYLRPEARLEFIPWKRSRYAGELEARGQTQVPVGVLDGDVEIVFLHYHSPEEAAEKWYRRARRVNWDHMILKFAQMNGATREQICRFLALDAPHKLCFVNDKSLALLEDCVYYHVYDAEGSQITNDTDFPFAGMDICKIINSAY